MAFVNYQDHKLDTNGVIDSTSFELSNDDGAHLMHLLRDSIYSDTKLAVLREYATNAWDAHVAIGAPDCPIEITLPTTHDYTLTIRDYGSGLSHDKVKTVYTRYGKSTKRDDPDQAGMLGIGSKSAFAYTDSFTVTSFHEGKRRVYIAALDPTGKGSMNLVDERDTDEHGIEIKIAIKPGDIAEFEKKAKQLYVHFGPRPTINIDLPLPPLFRLTFQSGVVDYIDRDPDSRDGGVWTAVMGCVPYRIRLEQLTLAPEHECLLRMNGTLRFPINALHIAASREELKYTQATKDAIVERFTALVDEFVTDQLKKLEAGKLTAFEQRLQLRLMGMLGFKIPGAQWESLSKSTVRVFDDADTAAMYFVRDGSVTNTCMVTSDLRILIDDTGKDLKGYDLQGCDYVVRRAKKRKVALKPDETAGFLKELNKYIDACTLTGVPIVLLSTLTWDESRLKKRNRGGGAGATPLSTLKRKTRVFEYNGGFNKQRPSDNWDIVEDHEPSDDDVFVIIESYKVASVYAVSDHDDWKRRYNADAALASALGVEFPAVIGYKSTESKPFTAHDVTDGRSYDQWRKDFINGQNNEAMRRLVGVYFWTSVFKNAPSKTELAVLTKRFGEDHPITLAMLRRREAEDVVNQRGPMLRNLAAELRIYESESEAHAVFDRLLDRYPLLRAISSWSGPWSTLFAADNKHEADDTKTMRKAWIQYIKGVDLHIADDGAKVFDDLPNTTITKPALALVP